ncbi:Protein N-acetyltransferase, RimJ/RimL family [Paenibacillus sp. UNCCL117]|uniref:GNAT family N-acetyltransferase n=1 Tax=unclassified Paenibacillus TaxID=185978 RepID=UPI0008803CF0|nr:MULTISPECIES: GNAT family protein [unclassified Paenibacillus]SDC67577.1 Protein N-acetyltransferase, RimJ/RimL family [Paenibacillus sp. cl123]SFW23359.1 Protein N-acetyltransferase, RimJ/RimL family [Paenibacillus sp. UNCCL117]
MITRILRESDAESYHKLRLEALQTNPEAFGSTYEREAAFTQAAVIERIRPNKDKFVLGAFNESGHLVGIVTFIRESGVKMAHKGHIYGMYVAEEMQGKGLGKTLLLELIRKAKECDGLEQLNLTVVAHNEAAKKLYGSLGFQRYGVERNALKYDGRYADEDLMVLWL